MSGDGTSSSLVEEHKSKFLTKARHAMGFGCVMRHASLSFFARVKVVPPQ